MNCLGVPVRYNPKLKFISESRGLWPFKRIVVGPGIRAFAEREQQAILLHEVGHCKMFHLEKRILRVLTAFFRPSVIIAYCHAQEFSADEFVAHCGYGLELARAFTRLTQTAGVWHPRSEDRIARLLAWHSRA
jgi:Zn-dependent protease with chaperone function